MPQPLQFRDLLAMTALGGRVVCTGDLTEFQIVEFRARGWMWVDPETHMGYCYVPWNLSTPKDKDRERRLLGPP